MLFSVGRSLEKSKDHRSSSSAATMISPRKQQDVITSQQPQQPQPQPRSSGTVEVEVRRIGKENYYFKNSPLDGTYPQVSCFCAFSNPNGATIGAISRARM